MLRKSALYPTKRVLMYRFRDRNLTSRACISFAEFGQVALAFLTYRPYPLLVNPALTALT